MFLPKLAPINSLKKTLAIAKSSFKLPFWIWCACAGIGASIFFPIASQADWSEKCAFCYWMNSPEFFQHPGKGGQSIYSQFCTTSDGCRSRRKKLSEVSLYEGDPTSGTWDNVISSVRFYSDSDAVLLYQNANYEGPCIALYLKRGTKRPDDKGWVNLSDVGFNDRTSSYKLTVTSFNGDGGPSTRCQLVPLVLKVGQPNQLVPAQ
jgi:hypothetical protein